MKRSYIRHAGKKVKAWAKARVKLKVEFMAMGITTCELRYEGCFGDNGLGFAHHSKRRKLKPEDMTTVILICNACHDKIEVLPPLDMFCLVNETIAGRASALSGDATGFIY